MHRQKLISIMQAPSLTVMRRGQKRVVCKPRPKTRPTLRQRHAIKGVEALQVRLPVFPRQSSHFAPNLLADCGVGGVGAEGGVFRDMDGESGPRVSAVDVVDDGADVEHGEEDGAVVLFYLPVVGGEGEEGVVGEEGAAGGGGAWVRGGGGGGGKRRCSHHAWRRKGIEDLQGDGTIRLEDEIPAIESQGVLSKGAVLDSAGLDVEGGGRRRDEG